LLLPEDADGEQRIVLLLPDMILEQVRRAQRFSYEDEPESTWLLPSWHHGYQGQHMTPCAVVQLIGWEAERQKIPMTCHRIQLAGAVDALRRGEEPKDVFGRLGYEPGTGELGAVFKKAVDD